MQTVEIHDNVVINLIEIAEKYRAGYERATGNLVLDADDYLDIQMGDVYDPETGKFSRDGVQVEAIAAQYVRGQLLRASDYTQTLDYPCTDAERDAWRDYRQALRDLPDQPGWPEDFAWPKVPGREKAPDTMQAVLDTMIGGTEHE